MKTTTMRLIDRYVGTVICHVLSWIVPLFKRKPNPGVVVVCKFFGIGSICLSYPLIYELKKQNKKIVFLTFKSNEAMIKLLGVDDCLSIDTKSFIGFGLDVFKLIWRLRKIRPEVFLNLEFFSQFAAIMSLMSGAPIRSGFHILHLSVGKLYTHRTNLNVYRTVTENFLNVAVLAGQITNPQEPGYYPDTFSTPSAFLPPAGIADKCIVLNAEGSDTTRDLKSWPPEYWVKLIAMLRDRCPEYAIVLIGTDSQSSVHKAITRKLDDDPLIISCVGKTNFSEFIGLISRSSLLITVDSGPLHLGALMKRPTIAMMGPETPYLYGHKLPWVRTFYKNLMCSPCLAIYGAKVSVLDCKDNICMKQILPEDVAAAALEMLADNITV